MIPAGQSRHPSFVAVVDDATPSGLILRSPAAQVGADLAPGEPLILRRHADQRICTATAEVSSVHAGDPVLLVTGSPANVERDSTRHLYRVATDLHAVVAGERWRVGDLSGSGCLLIGDLHGSLRPGAAVEVVLELPGSREGLRLRADVVRAGARGGRQAIGLEFVDLTRSQEDQIVRYVYSRQKELLRLGLLQR